MSVRMRREQLGDIFRKIKYACEKKWKIDRNNGERKKENVVVLGSGWGGIHFMLNIDFEKYNVTLVSPRNYFTFTPLLPCLCSGTLSVKSCKENVHKFLKKKNCSSNYFQYECTDIMYNEKYIICKDKNNKAIKILYDYLVIAVGAKSNSFNIKGVEKYAFFVKDIDDALKIRDKFLENLEKCKIKNYSEEKKKNLLHIVVVGGGPTGVEVAGEFADFVNKEIKNKYKNIYPYISISIIESGNKLLPTFTENISKFTINNFNILNINVYTNYCVTEIDENYFFIQSSLNQNEKKKKIPYGLIIWASGIKQTLLVNNFLKKIPEQVHNNILHVNAHLKVIGLNNTLNIFAIGDCKMIKPLQLHKYTYDIINFLNTNNLNSNCLKLKSNELCKIFPQVSENKWDYFKNKKDDMNEREFENYLLQIDRNYKTPSPTAQNAKQEAFYLSYIFNNYLQNKNNVLIPSFLDTWKGSLAYIGNHQVVAHLPFCEIKGGFFSFTFWRIVYIQLLLTWRSRLHFLLDTFRTSFYGRPVP
ncbi:type II NADH:ubiquinone oxidoreductase, putative [Plasmodium ovale]|uniref:NADH:ubiquinone reductase (non-electrogenic) n=1 Tax=Plasmodium ovale TaxID=36330 RepID=A0A1C3KQI9_PLAOA|nr:type II NADH:ubiquinone oxidoreductase, putative [Plasmodium ovale]